ncbi:glycosyltransferase [Aliivibrio fischeri]|uniref:glycosyltransferase n=1 Tax=Aliivibrio fischeri TaxID=668 RepID=UPI00107EBC93|nr:glycosyltransferase [Aliivibrio fischeri]TGA73344.1 glycosyltransferase [Aliivibrio fischeri]
MINIPNVAVAMSVYKSDKLSYLIEAINSILEQEYEVFHIYIEVDGAISSDVKSYLNSLNPETATITYHRENKGLATRLNQAIDKIIQSGQFSYIARMDSDDISDSSRFREQVDFLSKNQDVYVLGTDIIEIDNDNNPIYYKHMESDSDKIKYNIIKKCPVNHPSVMFRVDLFDNFKLRYQDNLMNTQDYYLWVDVINKGLKISNLNIPLLKFRIDENFHNRRGFKKAINEFNSRIYAMNKLSIFSFSNILHTILLLSLRLSPEPIKKFAYRYMR